MNKTYRLIWNEVTQTWVAVAEHAKRRGKRAAVTIILAAAGFAPAHAASLLPSGGQVVSGAGSVSQPNASTLDITQTSNKLAIDWQRFDIGQGHTVNFIQPSAAAVALNRVVGADVSSIQGALNANGQVFLINPNGVLFSPTAQVEVGALLASTRNISNSDFAAGNYRFSGNSSGRIVNQGEIQAADGGYVALVAANIENAGSITANQGSVLVGAGNRVRLDLGGPAKLEVEAGALEALIANGGALRAEGGQIFLTAQAAGDLASSVINNSGVIEANSLSSVGGQIVLIGDHLANSGTLSAAGATGGGEILLGGDLQGAHADHFPHATTTTLTASSVIDASATQAGDGGTVIVWSGLDKPQGTTTVDGVLRASAAGGRGGFVETSGKTLNVADTTQVQTGGGEWLLDPVNITVGAVGSGSDLTQGNITNTLIQSTLAAGTDVELQASNDININESLAWNQKKLTLTAGGTIHVNAVLTVTDSGALTLNPSMAYDKGVQMAFNSDGSFLGRIDMSGSGALLIDNATYTRIDDATGLAGIASGLSGKYYLGADIATGLGSWTSINSFAGQFEGFGHTLQGLTSTSSGKGLFGDTTSTARISNLGLTGGSVSTSSGSVGGLVAQNLGIIANSYNAGSVTGTSSSQNYFGGLVAINRPSGKIINSHATGHVTGLKNGVGGLAGYNDGNAVIANSYATGNVSGVRNVGGLVGDNNEDLSNTYATGNVTASNQALGGLVGLNGNSAVISNSYATGNVTQTGAGANAGGLVGQSKELTSIQHSYATGNVTTGGSNAYAALSFGGLVGVSAATISSSYATGTVR